MAPSDWLVQVPLSQLVALHDMATELDKIRFENEQLRRELSGLHTTLYQVIDVVGELRCNLPGAGRRA